MKPIFSISILSLILSCSLFADKQDEVNINAILSVQVGDKPITKSIHKLNKEATSYSGISEDQEDASPIEWGEYIISKFYKKPNGELSLLLKYKMVYEPEKNEATGSLTQRSKTQLFTIDIKDKPTKLVTFDGKVLSVSSSLVDDTGAPIKPIKAANKA